MRITRIFVTLLAVTGLGCERHVDTESRTLSESVSYGDANDHERLKQKLSNAGIPYKVAVRERGQEFVEWDARYTPQVERIKDSLFLPSGRNIHLDAKRQSQFKAWLDRNNIPYRTMVEDNREYVVWEEIDAERVRS